MSSPTSRSTRRLRWLASNTSVEKTSSAARGCDTVSPVPSAVARRSRSRSMLSELIPRSFNIVAQAGVSLNQQIQQISQGIQAGLDPVRAAIAKDNQELMAQKAKLPAAQYQQRQAALQQRADAYSQTVQTRSAQIAQTREKALVQIATAVNPLLVATKASRGVQRRLGL